MTPLIYNFQTFFPPDFSYYQFNMHTTTIIPEQAKKLTVPDRVNITLKDFLYQSELLILWYLWSSC